MEQVQLQLEIKVVAAAITQATEKLNVSLIAYLLGTISAMSGWAAAITEQMRDELGDAEANAFAEFVGKNLHTSAEVFDKVGAGFTFEEAMNSGKSNQEGSASLHPPSQRN